AHPGRGSPSPDPEGNTQREQWFSQIVFGQSGIVHDRSLGTDSKFLVSVERKRNDAGLTGFGLDVMTATDADRLHACTCVPVAHLFAGECFQISISSSWPPSA